MSDYIKFEGGSFSKSFIASHESEEAFLTAMGEKGYQHLFEGKERDNKLRALYAKVSAKNVEPVTEDAPKKKGK